MSSKKHANAAGQSSRGSSSKGWMQLTSYLWKKIGMLWKKLWKSYGISFLGICTNPDVVWLCKLCHSTHSAPSFSLGSRSRFNESCALFVSLHPLRRSTPSAVSARMKWGLNRLSRPCHVTCFFTSTIRLRPRLTSRALLLSLFSMPDKLSGCRSFRFFPKNNLIAIFLQ